QINPRDRRKDRAAHPAANRHISAFSGIARGSPVSPIPGDGMRTSGYWPRRMPRWLPLGSARRLAALLLLLGVMLGGGFDAIVCEPSTEIAVAAVDSADHDSHQQGPDSDRHGGCIH